MKMTNTVWATKYRPHTFAEVSGQPDKIILKNMCRYPEKFPPLVILSGTSGVGKTTLARIVSMSLNCEDYSERKEPCRECEGAGAVLAPE